MFFWPLHPTVLHLFSAACFTCLFQAAAVAVAGGRSGNGVLVLSPVSLSPLGKLSKQADTGFPPSPSLIGAITCPDA